MFNFDENLLVFSHVGTLRADLLIGESNAYNVFLAGAGDDIVVANGSTNVVAAGAGNDLVAAMGGFNNALDGGAGNDTMFIKHVWGTTTAFGGLGNDTITMYGGEGWNSFLVANGGAGNDSISGGDGNDSISGGAHHDTLRGGWGDDFISGDAGNDVVSGGLGNDHLYGGTGSDRLSGSGGQDWLDGGMGNDTLYGGRLADVFVFQEFIPGERDVVADYKSGEDVILIGYDDYTLRQVGTHVLIEVESATSTASMLVLNATVADVQVDDLFWGKG